MLATVCLHTRLNANGQNTSPSAIHAAESEHQPPPGGCPVITLSMPGALLVHPPATSAYRSVSYEAILEAGGSAPWLQPRGEASHPVRLPLNADGEGWR